jgi:hypothetical protein
MRVRRRVRRKSPPSFRGDRSSLNHIFSGGDWPENDAGYILAQKIKNEFNVTGWASVTIDSPSITIRPPSIAGAWEADMYLLSAVPAGKGTDKRAFRRRRTARDPDALFRKIQDLLRASCNYVEIAPTPRRALEPQAKISKPQKRGCARG